MHNLIRFEIVVSRSTFKVIYVYGNDQTPFFFLNSTKQQNIYNAMVKILNCMFEWQLFYFWNTVKLKTLLNNCFISPPTQCCGSSAQRTTSTPAALSRCWSGGWRTPLTRLRTKCWRPTVNWLWRYNMASRTLFIGHNEGSQVCHICTLHANQANVNYKCQEFGSVRPRGRCVIALINTKTTVDKGGNGRTEWGARWKKVSAAASHLYISWAPILLPLS